MSEETLQTLDLAAVAKETEGYTPQDLVLLLERAVHANTVKRGHSEQGIRDFSYTTLLIYVVYLMVTSSSLTKQILFFSLSTFIIMCLHSVSLRCLFVVEGLHAGSQGIHASLAVGCRSSHP